MKSRWNEMFAFRLPVPLWAPPGEGTSGEIPLDDGTGDENNESELDLDLDDDEEGGEENESEQEEEISLDDENFLDKLYGDTDEEDEDNSDTDVDSEERQQEIANEMKEGIAAFAIPEDAIPADFDPSDPKQLRELLAATHRSAIQTAIKVMWKPVGAAMEQTLVRMRMEMRDAVKSGVGENNLQAMLDREIPNHTAPGTREVVRALLTKARKKFPKSPAKAVQATKKSMQAMGIKIGAAGSKPGQGGGKRRASDVLDDFAKLPSRMSQNPSGRLAERLARTKNKK